GRVDRGLPQGLAAALAAGVRRQAQRDPLDAPVAGPRRGSRGVERCDVLIVGGGPAGSSCAWKLARAGVDVVVVDRQAFTRDKVGAGWITPQVLADLELAPADYAEGRTFQPFHGFRVGVDGGSETAVDHGRAISFGIRRCEFDDYLLRRSGARLALGRPLRALERTRDGCLLDAELRPPLLLGA